MIRASVDIGTNSVLLLVAEKRGDGRLDILHEEQRVPRLGKDVDVNRNLHPESMDRVIGALEEYREVLKQQYPEIELPVVTATSAVRDAANKDAFVRKVLEATGYKVRVLSGEQEAEYTFKGALSVLEGVANNVVVLDIGGGSTEVAVGLDRQLADRHSFDIGSVRFTERFLDEDPTDEQVERCWRSIQNELEERPFELPDDTILVGVAGTVTSIAHMISGQEKYDSSALNGMVIDRSYIQEWITRIRKWSVSTLLEKYPEVMKGREDVFLAGLLILDGFMARYDVIKLTVSAGGIRHGALLKAD